jgi:hypothetical protein
LATKTLGQYEHREETQATSRTLALLS